MLATTYDRHSVLHAGAACLHVDTAVVIGHGLLAALVAPVVVPLGALLSILGGDIRRWSPDAARCWVRLLAFSLTACRVVALRLSLVLFWKVSADS
jgi:hypothetical protein